MDVSYSQANAAALRHAASEETAETAETAESSAVPSRQSDAETRATILRAALLPPGPEQLRLISALTRRSGGLKTDSLRQLAWPVLLGCSGARATVSEAEKHPHTSESQSSLIPSTDQAHWRDLPEHKDESQVRLDVNRSFIYYPHNLSESQLDNLKIDLLQVITATLRRYPRLCYFQGFHDIIQLLLLVLGKDVAVEAAIRLSLFRLRDFMLPSLSSSLTQLELLPAILTAADPRLAQHLSQTRPYFALAATLTMFAHDIESYAEIARLFDFLLAEDAVVAIYLYSAIILSRREELLDISSNDEDMLFFRLQKLPKTLDFEALIKDCLSLVQAYPPEKLPRRAWGKISPNSVLKTTRGRASCSLAEAERFFDAQLTQSAWQERRNKALNALWVHRRPVSGLGAAVLVALLAYWLQRGSSFSVFNSAANGLGSFGKMLLRLSHD